MSEKLVFEVGIRLLGLHFLLQGLPLFLITVGELLVLSKQKNGLTGKRKLVSPDVFRWVFNFYRHGRVVDERALFFYRMAFQAGPSMEAAREFFVVGTKLFGVLLVIGTVPSLLDALTYFLLFAVSPFAGPDLETRAYFVPQLGSMLFGILLFFRGELLANWAFAERNPIAVPIKMADNCGFMPKGTTALSLIIVTGYRAPAICLFGAIQSKHRNCLDRSGKIPSRC